MSKRHFSDKNNKSNGRKLRTSALLCALLFVASAAVFLVLSSGTSPKSADSAAAAGPGASISADPIAAPETIDRGEHAQSAPDYAAHDGPIADTGTETVPDEHVTAQNDNAETGPSDTAGDAAPAVGDAAPAVGGGGGQSANQSADVMEITEERQNVVITDRVEHIIVAGAKCTISIAKGAHVRKLELLETADGCQVATDGTVGSADVSCKGAQLTGAGTIGTITLNSKESKLTVRYYNVVDNTDRGLKGASVSITAPSSILTGKRLIASAAIEGAEPGKECKLIWYVNGEEYSESTITTGEPLQGISYNVVYDRHKPDTTVISVAVQYESRLGEQYEISAEASVKLENYNREYWLRFDSPEVLKKVTTGYKGDFTLQYALDNDYTEYEKEVWVNAKGYKSDTKYLIWISIAYQRVNIFKGSAEKWDLIHSCIVGTGAPGRGTMLGVCKTTYKQKYGWTTSDYTCRPVVRFREGTGYAFHSRLYYPNSDRIKDDRIGFPISLGCIRMYDEDIQFIYDNIPNGTTVVIY